jgi:hypothetical protein
MQRALLVASAACAGCAAAQEATAAAAADEGAVRQLQQLPATQRAGDTTMAKLVGCYEDLAWAPLADYDASTTLSGANAYLFGSTDECAGRANHLFERSLSCFAVPSLVAHNGVA